MVRKVVLISTGQPTTNPRLVKEANSLQKEGYDVTVLYCYCIQWACDFDKDLLKNVLWKHQLVGGSPNRNKLLYLFTRLRFKLARIFNRYSGTYFMAERAQARAFDELLHAAKKIKANLYIGHNLGALPVAVRAAMFNEARAGFDFEDYHRGEFGAKDHNMKRITRLEKKYVQSLSYYSTSSQLIAEAVKKDHPDFEGATLELLNCFPDTQQLPVFLKERGDDTLRLFWFSQTIGKNRGLETLIAALNILADPKIKLMLVGRCDTEMRDYINNNAKSIISAIHFKDPIKPSDLIGFASQFDVGLACEDGTSQNRDLCLTNKIFTYLLAGNAILASNTKAQSFFFKENRNVGLLFEQNNSDSLAQKIIMYKNNRSLLLHHKTNAFTLAKEKMNWKTESQKFIELCRQFMQN